MADLPKLNKTIAFVSNSAWSVFNFRLDVIRYLQQHGYEVIVLSPDDEYSRRLIANGCRFVPIEFNNKGENPLKDFLFYRKLRRLYRRLRPDFIFHYVAKPNIYGSLAASAEHIPCVAVITGLGYPFAKKNWLFSIIKALYKKALRNTREVWFLNNEDAKVFITEKIVGIGKMKVLPGEGVNTDHFSSSAVARRAKADLSTQDALSTEAQPPSLSYGGQGVKADSSPEAQPPSLSYGGQGVKADSSTEAQPPSLSYGGQGVKADSSTEAQPPSLSYGGQRVKVEQPLSPFSFLMSTRLLKSKGVSLYADAARILKKKGYHASFSLIGFFEKGHPDSITQEDLHEWEKEGLIRYYGFADDVREYLSRADCFVFPSFYNEGVPRCLMEAASMVLPIITSLNRGCKEVVLNNSNGYICSPNDPFDLADKMEKMMTISAEERSRMGRNGRQLVLKKFGLAKIVQEYSNTLISAFESAGDIHPTPEKTKNSG